MVTAASSASPSAGRFLGARVASLLGVAPLGVWTAGHLWNNLAALRGPQAWQAQVTEYPHPVAQAITVSLVLLPLVLHSIWGVGRLLSARPNNPRYNFFGNLKYALQRMSAIGVLLFLGAHIWLAMLQPRLVEGHAEAFDDIAHQMRHHGPTLVVYLLGTLGVAYHLSNGIASFAMGWGVVSSQRALRRVDKAAAALFVLLLGMSWTVVYALYAAGA